MILATSESECMSDQLTDQPTYTHILCVVRKIHSQNLLFVVVVQAEGQGAPAFIFRLQRLRIILFSDAALQIIVQH
jgi:hypothetical protein